MKYKDLVSIFNSHKFKEILSNLYGNNLSFLKQQNKRYKDALKRFLKLFDIEDNIFVFSSPGRVELIGNHTDHNNGLVVGASINRDMIAFTSPIKDNKIIIISEGFKEKFIIPLNNLNKEEDNQTTLLVKGMLKGLIEYGYKIGGFYAYVTSDIAKGSGISSSASFEMLFLSILNKFYNNEKIDILTLAKIGQFAENQYWNKPSGLLDQLTTSYGGIIAIDFKEKDFIKIERLNNIFMKNKYVAILINTGEGHEKLTKYYAEIPDEMKAVAKIFRKKVLREINEKNILKKINIIRKNIGDRALLRSLHFFNENKRVEKFIYAIKKDDINEVIKLMNESGDSSWMLLQNCYIPGNIKEQNIPMAICLTKEFLNEKNVPYSVRVHGGGFAGVILVVIPEHLTETYTNFIGKFFGKNSIIVLKIRDIGIININNLIQGV